MIKPNWIAVVALAAFGCETKKAPPPAPAVTSTTPVKPTPDAAVALQDAPGTRAAREDFVVQSTKHPEFPFRASLGSPDTELVIEFTDPSEACTKELMTKLIELLGTQMRSSGFKRVACKDQQSSVDLGGARAGSRAQRQAFVDEAAKNPDLGFALSLGQVDTDLLLELTPPAGTAGADMPCSREVLMKLLESFREPMKAAGYRRFRCKGPWLTVEI